MFLRTLSGRALLLQQHQQERRSEARRFLRTLSGRALALAQQVDDATTTTTTPVSTQTSPAATAAAAVSSVTPHAAAPSPTRGDTPVTASVPSPRDTVVSARREGARAFLRTLSGRHLVGASAATPASTPMAPPAPGAAVSQAPHASLPPVVLSTQPSDAATHWKQAVLMLRSPVRLTRGEAVAGRVSVTVGHSSTVHIRLALTSHSIAEHAYTVDTSVQAV